MKLHDKRHLSLALVGAMLVSMLIAYPLASASQDIDPLPVLQQEASDDWQLLWSDEFDADAGAPINDDYWTCELGGHGWGNEQLEFNTDRLENVAHTGDGMLAITAREEEYEGNAYTSARCNTMDKVEFTYGKVEARIDLPEGQGIWPAFWMLGADFPEIGWPQSGEIDIMEYVGKEPRSTHGTIHGPGYSGNGGLGARFIHDEPAAEGFHIYGIEWEPNVIRWYVDGELYFEMTPEFLFRSDWVFNHDFFIIINVAVGGLWPGNPDDSTVFPQEMLVDWVRVYQRTDPPISHQIEPLIEQMTLEEKVGQMALVRNFNIELEDVANYHIGAILSGGGDAPDENTPEAWAEMVGRYQEAALESRLGIPLLYGADGVHGHSNVRGTVIFPHNIGLGAANNPALVEEICAITAQEMAATGIYWNFAPTIAVPQDIRWGRTYEGFSETTDRVTALGTACLNGLQGDLSAANTVLGTPKHYIGDGATDWGSSTKTGYSLDQGRSTIDEATLRAVHLPPYIDAIENGALSMMVSYSSWDGTRMHVHDYLINDVLKDELGYEGFVVSDWGGVEQLTMSYSDAVTAAINAGVDMHMLTGSYQTFIEVVIEAVENEDIEMARIDDAVRRILRAKIELGLFDIDGSQAQADLLPDVGSNDHRAVARQAVSQSLVLLKNEGDALPIQEDIQTILVAGAHADDIGLQSGGWTIAWQGAPGAITDGTTILDGIQELAPENVDVMYDRRGEFDVDGDSRTMGIVAVGEQPYAEGQGDNADLLLSDNDIELIAAMREQVNVLVVVLVSGRPMIINDSLDLADAFVAAWLPGSEGAGVADALFGETAFTGTLPFTWPQSVDQLPLAVLENEEPLFPMGFGLTTE